MSCAEMRRSLRVCFCAAVLLSLTGTEASFGWVPWQKNCIHRPSTSSLCDVLGELNLYDTGSLKCRSCKTGQFWDHDVGRCRSYLDCDDIAASVQIEKDIHAYGGVKRIHRGFYKGLPVAVSVPHSDLVNADFMEGVKMLSKLQNHTRVVQLIGFCRKERQSMMITPFYELGGGHNWNSLLSGMASQSKIEELRLRWQAGRDYLAALQRLHMEDPESIHLNSQESYVLCDGREGPTKILSQFVISSSFRLLLNDVDATPNARDSCGQDTSQMGVQCGHLPFRNGEFVAPEQIWPYPSKPFVEADMPCYDERTDIWRIPEVLNFVLGDLNSTAVEEPYRTLLIRHMKTIEKKCKENNVQLRPNVTSVLNLYDEMYKTLTRYTQISI